MFISVYILWQYLIQKRGRTWTRSYVNGVYYIDGQRLVGFLQPRNIEVFDLISTFAIE